MTLWQGDKRWGSVKVNGTDQDLAHVGCLITALTEAARILAGRISLLPPHANEIFRQGNAFAVDEKGRPTASLIVHRAARLLGMESPNEEKITLLKKDPLDDVCAEILARGEMVIVQVSNQSGTKTTPHYLLATHAAPTGEIVTLDPALARAVPLDRPAMRAVVMWKREPHTYRAMSVRPLRPGPSMAQ